MGDQSAADEIRAAGGVLWRPDGRAAQVAVIHRPKYDDWSFAKGKVDPGEHVLLAAVREVAEETGLQVTLGRRLTPVRYLDDGVPKLVDYWVARPDDESAGFAATSEVDALEWLAAAGAGTRLSYSRDVDTLGEFTAGPWQTFPLILVRHVSAGSKSDWPADDLSRPLDARGTKDAGLLARLLRCFGVCRIVSSPAERCVATVRPYAQNIGGEVEIEPAFEVIKGVRKAAKDASPAAKDASPAAATAAAARAAAELAAADLPVIICAHRENLTVLLESVCATLGADSPVGRPLRKGEFLVLHRVAGKLAAVERHQPDGSRLAGVASQLAPPAASAPRADAV
jgi:8-oxo-(d)GTP phosphatase